MFTPKLGEMIPFDLRIFFRWVGEKPPTRTPSQKPTPSLDRKWVQYRKIMSELSESGCCVFSYMWHIPHPSEFGEFLPLKINCFGRWFSSFWGLFRPISRGEVLGSGSAFFFHRYWNMVFDLFYDIQLKSGLPNFQKWGGNESTKKIAPKDHSPQQVYLEN